MGSLLMMKRWIKESSFWLLFLSAIFLSYYFAQWYGKFIDFSRYALTPTTQSLIHQFQQTTQLTLYTQDVDLYHQVQTLVRRYQILQPNIQFTWQNQSYVSSKTPAVLILTYNNQQQIVEIDRQLQEAQLTQAFFKLQRKHNQWIVFLQGHGEPELFGQENKDFRLLQMALQNQGLHTQRLNLTQTSFIPDNTQVLIIAAPKSDFLPQEKILLTRYLEKGGDLLWLMDPDSKPLPFLNEQLGISPLSGTIVDLHGQRLGTPHPAITLIDQYTHWPFEAPKVLTAFPWATALAYRPTQGWEATPLLMTHEACWTETDNLNGAVRYNPEAKEMAGPLLLGISLSRQVAGRKEAQRVVVIGNSRFLSNGAIENYGNLALGLNVLNWLAHDDTLLNIQQPVSEDSILHLSFVTAFVIQYGFAIVNILLLLGIIFYFYRRSALSQHIATTLSRS